MALVLDAGALIGLERHNRVVALALAEFRAADQQVIVPAGALAQAWRSGTRQARLAVLIKAPDVKVEPLTEQVARAAGELCRHANTEDVVDASVVVSARRHRATVLSSDPADLEHLDPAIEVVAC